MLDVMWCWTLCDVDRIGRSLNVLVSGRRLFVSINAIISHHG